MKYTFKALPIAALSMAALLFSSSSASAYAIQKNFTHTAANCVADVSYAYKSSVAETLLYVHIVEIIDNGLSHPDTTGDELLFEKITLSPGYVLNEETLAAEIDAALRDSVRRASANPLCNGELDGDLPTKPSDWPQ